MILIHILAGLVALVAGAVALSSAKGGALHRKGGAVFVYAMLTLTVTGAIVALAGLQRLNSVAAVFTFYLVTTGMLAVQRPTPVTRRIVAAAMGLAVLDALAGFTFGAMAAGAGHRVSAVFLIAFATGAALGAWGDWRTLTRGLQGPARIVRHLWRMGLAMTLATMSFFLGQAKVFPDALRKPALLAIPVLLVLAAMLYWLARVLRSPRA